MIISESSLNKLGYTLTSGIVKKLSASETKPKPADSKYIISKEFLDNLIDAFQLNPDSTAEEAVTELLKQVHSNLGS